MVVVRSIRVKGHTYYQAVERYREGRKVRQRFIVSLGTCPTIAEAFRKYEARYFAAREGKRREPFTAADRKAWVRLRKLEDLLRKDESAGYSRSSEFQAEIARWRRVLQREDKEAEREREAKEDGLWGDDITVHYATLGLSPQATKDEVITAYRRKARECHPDHGGSDAAMAALNEAKHALLSRAG